MYKFFSDEGNVLRKFVAAASDGAIFFVASVWCKAANGAIACRREEHTSLVGLTPEIWQAIARARLCDPDNGSG